MRRIAQTLVLFLVIASACLGYAAAQSPSSDPGHTLEFESIELTDSWTELQPDMLLAVYTDRGTFEHYRGDRELKLKAKLVDVQTATGMIETPPPGVEIGQPEDGLALVISSEASVITTLFGYKEAFYYVLLRMPYDLPEQLEFTVY